MFIEAKDDRGGGDNWTTGAISRAKLRSNHHHQQTNIQFFYRLDALPVAQPTVSKHWRENITFHGLVYTKLIWGVFQLCLWPLIAPGYLGGGLPCLSSALWCQYSNFNIMHCLVKNLGYVLVYSGIFLVHGSNFRCRMHSWCQQWFIWVTMGLNPAPHCSRLKSNTITTEPLLFLLNHGCCDALINFYCSNQH